MQHPSRSKPIGSAFFELQSVDSTNNYALGKVHAGMAYHGDCFYAHRQTAGKGQRGKSWITESSANIILSLVLQPDFILVFEQFQLSACIAVAIHEFFSRHAGADTKIKWPNDIYWKDRKAGGILIETVVSNDQSSAARLQWAIAGIGININQTVFSPQLANPVSLKQITGRTYDVIDLAKELCSAVEKHYGQLKTGGFAAILDAYNTALYKRNEIVRFKKANRIFSAMVKSVNSEGQLVVQHAIEENFEFGQVEWLV